jgi:hypothetical protein
MKYTQAQNDGSRATLDNHSIRRLVIEKSIDTRITSMIELEVDSALDGEELQEWLDGEAQGQYELIGSTPSVRVVTSSHDSEDADTQEETGRRYRIKEIV